MLINLFFFTVTISKRSYSNDEINKAYQIKRMESQLETLKFKHYDQQVRLF